MVQKKFHVAICIYEAAAFFSEVGAGIGVWPRIWKTLSKLGLDHDLARVTHLEPRTDLVDTFLFRKSDQAEGFDYYKLQTQGSFLTYHRPDVQSVLVSHLPPSIKVNYNKRVTEYVQKSGKVTVTFEDGSSTTCDLLIGADGIKSAVRRSMLQEQANLAYERGRPTEAEKLLASIEPQWTGIVAYRNLIPVERLQKYAETNKAVRVPQSNSIPTMYMGQHINVVVYPISVGKLINVGAFHSKPELAGTKFEGPWVTRVEKDDLIAEHAHWEPELRAILDCVEMPLRWAIHASVPIDNWVCGNVVLLGDAAHAMSPQQASGGGQAIEDAYILATLLGHHLTTKANMRLALSIYNRVRPPVANEVARRSLYNGSLFGLQLPGVDFTDTKNHPRLPEVGEAIKENWGWTWSTTLDRDIQLAVETLEREAGVTRAQL